MARFVLVHGAFGGAWCWEPVVPRLRAAGHEAEAFDLPGAGCDPTPPDEVTLAGYAARVCEMLANGPPAVLTGQSMGGMVITQAAAACPERVAALAYVSAFVPWDGISLVELTHEPEAAGDQVQANLTVEGDPPVARLSIDGALRAIYNRADPERARAAAAKLGPQPVRPFTDPFTLPSDRAAQFSALPRAYVSCLQDNAIKLAMQRRMYTLAGCDPVIEIDTDHSPWLSASDELVAALDRIARELT